jgi:hypothetical protein
MQVGEQVVAAGLGGGRQRRRADVIGAVRGQRERDEGDATTERAEREAIGREPRPAEQAQETPLLPSCGGTRRKFAVSPAWPLNEYPSWSAPESNAPATASPSVIGLAAAGASLPSTSLTTLPSPSSSSK